MSANRRSLAYVARKYIMELILLVTVIGIALIAEGFMTPGNLFNVMRNMSLKGVIAFGMTMVIIAGEIDLSISSTVALSGILVAKLSKHFIQQGLPSGLAVAIGVAAALLVAALAGTINGVFRTRFNIPSFIVTLAMMNILYGVAAIVTGGFPIIGFPEWFDELGSGELAYMPVPALILLLFFALATLLMNYMKFGRSVYAVGGNAESARLSGINVGRVKIIVMIICQVSAAVAGFMTASQSMSASFSFGKGWEMDVIASVIIGGASLNGGLGKVWGTFLGLVFLGVLNNGMTLMNVNEYVQYVVKGGLILFAVLINNIQTKAKA